LVVATKRSGAKKPNLERDAPVKIPLDFEDALDALLKIPPPPRKKPKRAGRKPSKN